jgi:predicted RNA-binding protein with PUA-like domain
MNYWLIKSEPNCYSWDQMMNDNVAEWEGVKNYQAQNNLRNMKIGDQSFFYHSITGKEIIQIIQMTPIDL